MTKKPYQFVNLNYFSLYFEDLDPALAFYGKVLGTPDSVDAEKQIYGWRLGATWLTFFRSGVGTQPGSNPRNCEFAIQMATAEEVDRLYQAWIEAGAKSCMAPVDTKMYEAMRFACVDDPFGVRIDVYCLLNGD